MPLYDAAGNPLGPVPVIGAKHLTSYPPLTNAELATIVTQLEQGLAHGVPVGGELDYLDEGTLTQAIRARRPL